MTRDERRHRGEQDRDASPERPAHNGTLIRFSAALGVQGEPVSRALARPGRRAADQRRHNLPTQLTTFVGREAELAEIERLLGTTRLLTLTGVGGIGKTRLAHQAAAGLLEAYPDGVWLVELAALADPGLVTRAVATALDVSEQAGQPLTETLAHVLRFGQVLLVPDNCEHLVEACAGLAETLLRACPRLAVLATSRQALGLAGETVWRVPSLSLPDRRRRPDREQDVPAALMGSEAVRLFVERARTALPSFSLTDRNAAAVVEICRRLDGIPLALELAAARVRLLTPAQIAKRLDDRFGLLTDGSRTALPRHQTLRALVDWSHDLLAEPEQIILRRLAVFTGGWSLEAAEVVCAGEPIAPEAVLGLLAELVEKSLVQSQEHGEEARYRLLETIRAYGLERLEASGEAAEVRLRHTDYYLALAESTEPRLRGPDQTVWLDRLEAEHDNLRAALRWAHASGETARTSRLSGAMWWFWYVRGHFGEGVQWLEQALAAAGAAPMAQRAQILSGLGTLARHQCDIARGVRASEEALALFEGVGDRWGAAWALTTLGLLARDLGDHRRSASLHERSLADFRHTGDRWGIAIALTNLGYVLMQLGDYARAADLSEESLAVRRAIGDTRGIAFSLRNLAEAARCRGDDRRAAALHEESLALFRQLGEKRGIAMASEYLGDLALARGDWERAAACFREGLALKWELGDRGGVAKGLAGLAEVAAARGQPERAARLFGAAKLLRDAIGAPLTPSERAAYERYLADVRARLKPELTAAWEAGQALPLDQAVDDALAEAPPISAESAVERGRPPDRAVGSRPMSAARPAEPSRNAHPLTRREVEVAGLIARGLTNRQIADELVITEWTADSHVRHILTKLGVASRAQVAAWASEQGLIRPDPS